MSLRRCTRDRNTSFVRPLVIGTAVSVISIIILMCIISLLFSLIECIVSNAISPLMFAAMALGCFAGGFVCAVRTGKRGVLCGAIIGAAVSLVIIIVGCLCSGFEIGSLVFIKTVVMIGSGCCGGYLGMNRRYGRKSR